MVKQTDAFQGSGIAVDIFRKLYDFLDGGQGVENSITTIGNSADTLFLPNVNHIVPSITVLNQGPGKILIGYGTAKMPMLAGDALTLTWINPSKRRFVYNDTGVAGTVVSVIG